MKVSVPSLSRDPRGLAGVLTTLAFFGCVGLAGWMVQDCTSKSAKGGECTPTFLQAGGLILAGAGLKLSNEAGFQTINPALDPYRKPEDEQPQGEPVRDVEPEPEPASLPADDDWARVEAGMRGGVRETEQEEERAQAEGVIPPFLQPFVEAAINSAVERATERMGEQITRAIMPPPAAEAKPKSAAAAARRRA